MTMIQIWKALKRALFVGILILPLIPQARSQGVPELINYQGKLSDSSGTPLPNGMYRVAFRLWPNATNATGENLIWGREYTVALLNGVFNVILGAPGGAPIPGASVNDLAFAFNQPNRFFGITLLAGVNGASVEGPKEILPRQQILSVPFALNGVPTGAIIMWSGARVPNGWALCDGTQGTPNLSGRFVVGASTNAAGSTVYEIGAVGGSDTHNHGGTTQPHTLTTDQMPSHKHASWGEAFENEAPWGVAGNLGKGALGAGGSDHDNWYYYTSPEGGNQPHSHAVSPDKHLPPYYALAFIMKL